MQPVKIGLAGIALRISLISHRMQQVLGSLPNTSSRSFEGNTEPISHFRD